MSFKLGDQVVWSGNKGTVVAVVNRRSCPACAGRSVFPPKGKRGSGYKHVGYVPRDGESYVVRAGNVMEWPQVSGLKLAVEPVVAEKPVAANKFAVGDTVRWTSQAGGTSKTKIGKIVAVTGPGAYVYDVLQDKYFNYTWDFKYSNNRSDTAYIVAIGFRLYRPYVSKLEKVDRRVTAPTAIAKVVLTKAEIARGFVSRLCDIRGELSATNSNTLMSDILLVVIEQLRKEAGV